MWQDDETKGWKNKISLKTLSVGKVEKPDT